MRQALGLLDKDDVTRKTFDGWKASLYENQIGMQDGNSQGMFYIVDDTLYHMYGSDLESFKGDDATDMYDRLSRGGDRKYIVTLPSNVDLEYISNTYRLSNSAYILFSGHMKNFISKSSCFKMEELSIFSDTSEYNPDRI